MGVLSFGNLIKWNLLRRFCFGTCLLWYPEIFRSLDGPISFFLEGHAVFPSRHLVEADLLSLLFSVPSFEAVDECFQSGHLADGPSGLLCAPLKHCTLKKLLEEYLCLSALWMERVVLEA